MQLNGIHHITAVSGNIAENLNFYTQVLGMRLVKKSVNQDDISAYHLFYADKKGTPGTDMTFFDWPQIGPTLRGTNSIVGTVFRVSGPEAIAFWSERFKAYGIRTGEITSFDGREILPFEDPEGQRLYLVDDRGAEFEGEIWPRPDTPDEFALRGFFSVVLSMPSSREIGTVFTEILNFEEPRRSPWIDDDSRVLIFTTNANRSPGSEIWLLEEPDSRTSRLGAGGVHHVAFRVADFESQKEWHSRLMQAGLHVSGLIDRFWFRSIYFRVSAGILFEIATDGPGFAVDENMEALGEKLVLPPFLESRRGEIEAALTPITG